MSMFRYAKSIVAAGALALALHPAASATTYYVSGHGSDSADGLSRRTALLTLQHAAGLTEPGDTVYALNGTYTNPTPTASVLNITTPGTADKWITYAAFPGENPLISFNSWAGISFGTAAAYIEVRGFSILGNNYNVTLAGATAEENTADPLYDGNCVIVDGRSGTATVRPNHIKIVKNVIGACGGAGIGALASDYITISDNTVYDSAWYSIYGNSAISVNSSWNSDAYTGYKFLITGNRVFGNQEFIPWHAVGYISDGEGIIIDTNRGSTSTYTGRTLIANNVVYQNGSSGIEAFASDHIDIFNNSTYNNDISPAPKEQNRGELNLNNLTDVNIVDNIYYSASGGNPIAVDVYQQCGCYYSHNLYYNGNNNPATIGGPTDAYADPLYLNPRSQDRFHVDLTIRKGSPAVDTGGPWIDHYVDFLGLPRPLGVGWDIGAYERVELPRPLF